jgi:aldose 1-epimerase
MKGLCIALTYLSALSSITALAAPAPAPAYHDLQASKYQQIVDGKPVSLYTLRNQHGVTVRITNYGGRIEQILAPDRNGNLGDIAQGYDSLDGVRQGQTSMGAFIGRYANRIAHGQFKLAGQSYQLAINDISSGDHPRQNTLHGGTKGSRFVVFDARQLSPTQLELRYVFKDGEEHFPGTLPVDVIYTLAEDNSLSIAWSAVADDKPTVANFTQHTFFNLSGNLGQPITDHVLQINAASMLAIDDSLVPTGKVLPVAGSAMDFRQPKAIGKDINADDHSMKMAGGYDHHFIINRKADELALAARVSEPLSGRVLEVWTTEPGVQFYSGNFLEGRAPRDVGKDGVVYQFRSAFCLEPSHYPDSVNHAQFPTTELKPGQWTTGKIVYRFLSDAKKS